MCLKRLSNILVDIFTTIIGLQLAKGYYYNIRLIATRDDIYSGEPH